MKQPFCAPSEALRRVLDAAAALPRPETETVPLDEAGGQIAARTLSARMDQPPFTRRGWLDWDVIRSEAAGLIQRFDVRTPSVDVHAGKLSGGNAQKLVLARELAPR